MLALSATPTTGRCSTQKQTATPLLRCKTATQFGVTWGTRRPRSSSTTSTATRTPSAVPGPQTSAAATEPVVRSFDFLVLGSGIAGLSYALKVAEYGTVAVVTKEKAAEGCTQYAQGGVSAVLAELDSYEAHIQDTLIAGDFLNCREAVEAVCREGPAEVLKLAELGAKFTRSRNGSLHLTKEGGHSARRVVHAEDATGREIERALLDAASLSSNITFFEHHLATELVVEEVAGVRHCFGADVLDQLTLSLTRYVAPVTMLATGGAGQVYPTTTNPSVSTGDGMAMAARAAATMNGMEFVQFHPTGFYSGLSSNASRTFLISEAVRGEGGLLFNKAGERFMPSYDCRLELAPRDIVARAIQDQMLKRGESHVLLDISHCQKDHVLTHFPNIAAQCREHGIDITQDPIPVAPAAHYMCGGVQTGLHGETSVLGLFAAGEVACTGLHGANRLASNSLLEGLVFASRAVQPSITHAEYAMRHAGLGLQRAAVCPKVSERKAPVRLQDSSKDWVAVKRKEVKAVMWESAGIVRCTKDMAAALQRLSLMGLEAQALLKSYGVSTELIELQNLITVGTHVLEAGLTRKESRGGHYNSDFPPKFTDAPQKSRSALSDTKLSRPAKPPKRADSDLGNCVRGASPPRPRPKQRDIVFRSHSDAKD